MKHCLNLIKMMTCVAVIVMMTFPLTLFKPTTVHAYSTVEKTIPDDSITRADVIVTKYKKENGIIYYRRWNETKKEWVDPYWIPV